MHETGRSGRTSNGVEPVPKVPEGVKLSGYDGAPSPDFAHLLGTVVYGVNVRTPKTFLIEMGIVG